MAAVAFFIVFSANSSPAKPDGFLPWTLNPTGLVDSMGMYIVLYLVSMPAKELMNFVLETLAGNVLGCRRLDKDKDEGSSVRKLEVLETVDICYLTLNTFIEYLGVNHLAAFLLGDATEKRLSSFGVLNGPMAFVFVLCLNDALYWCFHFVAHWRMFYPYCHKQHHRQSVPFRGYRDAGNQHPLEQFAGFSVFLLSLRLTNSVFGLHGAAAWCAFLGWAIFNIANHLPFDMSAHLPLPYPALPRDHQMHHRIPQCNYSKLTSIIDRISGTFRTYRPLGQVGEDRRDFKPLRHCEALPSWRSVACLGICLPTVSVLLEVLCTRSLPALQLSQFLRTAMLIVNVGAICYAVESIYAGTADQKASIKAKQ